MGPQLLIKGSCGARHVALVSTHHHKAPQRLQGRFSKGFPALLLMPQQTKQQSTCTQQSLEGLPEEADSMYSSLLEQAESLSFSCPLHGHCEEAERRSLLEDAERMLQLCVQGCPEALQPRVLLLRNLLRQSQGRERDVPDLAVQALQEADVPCADASMARHLHVLQLVMLGLKALYKVQELDAAGVAAPLQGPPVYSLQSFLAAAKAAAPSFEAEFDNLALRVQRQLVCCPEEQRQLLLADRDGFMCSVDLFAVCGQHHVA